MPAEPTPADPATADPALADSARIAPIAAADALAKDGYCVLSGALPPEPLAAARAALDEVATREVAAGTAWLEEPDNQRVWMLLNKGRIFVDLVLRGADLISRSALLGDAFLLSNATANIVRPGGKGQASHADQDFIPQPWHRAEVLTLLWMLDPFTEENGATRVLPGSHTSGERRDAADLSAAPCACGEAGSLLILDGRLWHGAGTGRPGAGTRRAVIVNYCRPYLRQQENFWRSIDPRLLDEPDLLTLLGGRVYDSLGMVNGLSAGWRERAAGEFGPSWR